MPTMATSDVATKLWTVEDFERLPDDGSRYALIRGVLYRMPPTKPKHGRVTGTVGRLLGTFVDEQGLGEIYDQSGFVLENDPDVLLGPDLAFVRTERVPANEDEYPRLAPDLVVEVISPSETGPSIEEKTAIYLAAGVRMVWALDPRRQTLRVRKPEGTDRLLAAGDEIGGDHVLPGFRLRVEQFFA
jgi:Uma2 family endonuclease